MRIIFTASGVRIGGATMAMFNLMLGLARLGHRPVLLSTTPSQEYLSLYRRLMREGVEIVYARRGPGAKHWFSIATLTFRIAKPRDIIHLHSPKEALIMKPVVTTLKLRSISTFEGDPSTELLLSGPSWTKRVANRLGERVMAGSDKVAACSCWLADILAKRHGREVMGVPNPVDVDRFVGIPRWGGERKVVLALARLELVKGIHVLARAARLVLDEGIDAEFWVAGEGSQRAAIIRLAERLRISGSFKLLGYTQSPEELLRRAYLLAMPSLYEPFGMPAAEAGAAGRPVVASRTGGLSEIVIDGYNGLLAKPGDHEELADKLAKLLCDDELAVRMGERGRVRAVQQYSPTAVARRYLELYCSTFS